VGMGRLALDLGRIFGQRVPATFWDSMDVVIPVPLHPLRQLRRGYNQAERFAAGVVTAEGIPRLTFLPKALQRRRNTRTQTKLDKQQRTANLRDAFVVHDDAAEELDGKGVVLVDDVVTTGATSGACTLRLLEVGVREVRVLSLARD